MMTDHIKYFLLIATLSVLSLVLTSCANIPSGEPSTTNAVSSQSTDAKNLATIDRLLSNRDISGAHSLLTRMEAKTSLPASTKAILWLQRSQWHVLKKDYSSALRVLTRLHKPASFALLNQSSQLKALLLKAIAQENTQQYFAAIKTRITISERKLAQTTYNQNHLAISRLLSQPSTFELLAQQRKERNSIYQQWIALRLLLNRTDLPLDKQWVLLDRWLKANPKHPAAIDPLPEMVALERAHAMPAANNIAVILPFTGPYSALADAIRAGITDKRKLSNYQPSIMFYDSGPDFISTYNTIANSDVDLIIGPLLKDNLKKLVALPKLPVITIALNRLDDAPSTHNSLYQFGLSAIDEINSLVNYATANSMKKAIIVYQDSTWAKGQAEQFASAWKKQGNDLLLQQPLAEAVNQSSQIQSFLPYISYPPNITNEAKALRPKPIAGKSVDFIALFSKGLPAQSMRPLMIFHQAAHVPVLTTSSIYRSYPIPAIDRDFQGVLFTDLPVVFDRDAIPKAYHNSDLIRLYAFGLDALLLAEKLPLLTVSESVKLDGKTGSITLKKNMFNRVVPMAEFTQDGIKPIP